MLKQQLGFAVSWHRKVAAPCGLLYEVVGLIYSYIFNSLRPNNDYSHHLGGSPCVFAPPSLAHEEQTLWERTCEHGTCSDCSVC